MLYIKGMAKKATNIEIDRRIHKIYDLLLLGKFKNANCSILRGELFSKPTSNRRIFVSRSHTTGARRTARAPAMAYRGNCQTCRL